MPSAESSIPDGFIQINDHPAEIWSKVAFDHVERLQTDEENRNPDAHRLYIYNDYFGYACCDLLKKEMLAIGKKIASKTEKLSLPTFQRLEALVLYMANSMAADVFHTIDDPELSEAIYTGYGALWMTYLLALETAAKPQKLSATHPLAVRNLENVVRTAAKVITQFSDLGFSRDARDLAAAMLRVLERNDMDGTPKPKAFLGKAVKSDSDSEDEDEEEEEEDARPAKKSRHATGADDHDVRAAAKEWKASSAMKDLRDAYGPVEHGGRPWDITKWSKAQLEAEKARFDGDGDEDDVFF
ncbi:hypothetical protein DFH07DRAFT_572949 [Mycena maculata]|uniref:Uncharacterized protein n=1 Tax=Mycena maculata TaxID=230809 RepID=A0AAD7ISP3_9AGAR|nr:hypothetical protein DFH07DRAFT_572949 [Mycena maculata]